VGVVEIGLMTVDEFARSKFFEDGVWELCEDGLVTMVPLKYSHEVVVMKLGRLFGNAIGDGKCWVIGSTAGVWFGELNSFVMPDLCVVCDESSVVDEKLVKSPDLVVEVLLRGIGEYDLGRKKSLYERGGAKEFWAVDLDEKWIEVENFERGMRSRFEVGDLVKSWLFDEFEFLVDDVLSYVLR
jgi:Uma2 family endonuclease